MELGERNLVISAGQCIYRYGMCDHVYYFRLVDTRSVIDEILYTGRYVPQS